MEVEPIRDMADVKLFYNWLKENTTVREAECFLIGCNIALRAGDLLQLKFSDISGKYIDLHEQKTTKFKRIPITQVVLDAVERLREFYSNGGFYKSKSEKFVPTYLFQGTGSRAYHLCQPITIQWLSILFKRASKALEFDFNVNTHTMRKTWGYQAYTNGQDILYLQAAFNHSNQRVTLNYIGITRSTVEKMYIDNTLDFA